MLLGKDERILFMDCEVDYATPTIRVPKEDLVSLVGAGVKTAMSFSTNWGMVEPVRGERDWSFYDNRMEELTSAGMKVYLHCLTRFPEWMPKEWVLVDLHKKVFDAPSMWNKEAWDYTLGFIQEIHDRYSSDQIVVVNSWLSDGEVFMPGELACFDKSAKDQYQKLFGRIPERNLPETEAWYKERVFGAMNEINKILIQNSHSELWTMLHPAIGTYGCCAPWIEQYLASIRVLWPDAIINQLLCTWAQWDCLYPRVKSMSETYRTEVFGGAEYATGIYDNSMKAIANGLRGVLCGPTHPFTKKTRIEPWMLMNMSDSLALWPVILSE